MTNPKWHAGRLLCACAGYFDWWRHKMLPEVDIDGGRADLLFISQAGYATEIEIKVTLSDWNADRDKRKWQRSRRYVARFFYAIPETLVDRIPEWVPESAGILSVHAGEYGDHVRIVRDAKRLRAEKFPPQILQQMLGNCYYRYWRERLNSLRQRYANTQPLTSEPV